MVADVKKRALVHVPDPRKGGLPEPVLKALSNSFDCRAGTLTDALTLPDDGSAPPVVLLHRVDGLPAPGAAGDLPQRLRRFVRAGGVLVWSDPHITADVPYPFRSTDETTLRELTGLALVLHVGDEAMKARLVSEKAVSPHKIIVQPEIEPGALAAAIARRVEIASRSTPVEIAFDDKPRQALLCGRPFPPPAPGRTAILILNYCSLQDTVRLVASLEASGDQDFDIYLIDNASPDTSRHELAARVPRAHVISLPENLGYAAGNNAAMRLIDGIGYEFLWILNPDIVTPPDALEKFVAAAGAHPEWSIFGPVISRSSNPSRVASAGCSISKENGVSITQVNARAYAAKLPPAPYRADFITGAAIFLRQSALAEIGHLPEGYFLYFEETQWLLEAAQKGHPSIVLPTIKLVHHQKSHVGGLPAPYYLYYFMRSALLFGHAMEGYDADAILDNLRDGFLQNWFARISENAPDKLTFYKGLVDQAIADGKAGRRGRVDLEAIESGKTAGRN
ncbi:MAG: glycosyltransferase family 2 protein [Paracoccus sp. (in: a-proteobacteria)]|uniref:glycosyltransferase family 2 protein n=1 Tax=Paracoccus sp. TaxID=267 RepID=UPI0007D94FE7|nr:hypothetical protein A8B76_15530 [Roseovarius indicus]